MIRVNGITIERKEFPDGTLLLNTEGLLLNNPTITWHYENDSELFTIICLAKKSNGYKNLVMPYIPHARMDRIKHNSDTHTLKYFAETINDLGFDKVYVLDPHSPVSEALINNICVGSPEDCIWNVIRRIEKDNSELVLFFPDAGASKRYTSMFPRYKYIYGNKVRTWETGEIVGTEIMNPFNVNLAGKTILMIDDICSKGTTFVKSAEALEPYSVGEVYLWVTHCENTILNGEVLTSGLFERVFTTDSIFTKEHEKVEVFEI